jgi:hypothetical protein
MSPDDERLLDRLGTELETPAREPPLDRVAAVRAHAAAQAPARPIPLWRRRTAALVAAAALLLVGVTAGVLVSDDLPRPVRRVAHDVGLPVDSPEFVDAHQELHRLGEALAAGDADEVRAADAAMVRLVKSLDDDERDELEPVAHEVHLRAVEFLEANESSR